MKLIVGNLKMNLLNDDINKYIDEVKKYNFNNVVYCPSNIYLKSFIDENLVVGSQDISAFNNGAYTGEISGSQLANLGVKYAIVGHSERRKRYNDSNFINDKLKRCLENKIKPILCIGESKEEYENNKTFDVLIKQINLALDDIDNIENIIIAYEPVWSIGTGLIPTNKNIENTIDYIKKYVFNRYSKSLKVLYGGSVNNKNINNFELINNVDGYLIGGCSIHVEDFIDLIKQVSM